MKKTKDIRAALYARVSTIGKGQDPEVQLQPLRRIARERNWKVIGEFVDIGQSGSKESRPELDRMMTMIRNGKVDILAVHRFDRLGRSVRHLLSVLDELRQLDVDFFSASEAFQMQNSVGRMVFTLLAGVAEFEKNLCRERVIASLEKAPVGRETARKTDPTNRP